MLFLARAAICIGLVAAAASGAGGSGLATALDRGTHDAAAAAGRACLRSSDCLRIGLGALAAASPDPRDAGPETAGMPAPMTASHPERRAERHPAHPAGN